MKQAAILAMALLLQGCQENEEAQTEWTLYVGTYTHGDSEGIYQWTFNSDTGALENKQLAATIENPSYLRFSPDQKTLYSVLETDTIENTSGGVVAYALVDGRLQKKGAMATVGAHPCHIAVSGDGILLAASSYSGGNVTLFHVDATGGLQANPQVIDLQQLDTTKTSRAHSAAFTKDGLFIADLGLNAVKRYTKENDHFVPHAQASLDLPEGAGPRHFAFSADGSLLYTINELNSTVTVFKKRGNNYEAIETQSTLAADFTGQSYCADIHLSPDGKFLYGSNRGENTIVVYKIDPTTGKLDLVGRESVRGDWPRNFTLDPTGKFLLVANQKSNNITVFERDAVLGTLSYRHEVALPSPVCLVFLE